MKQLHFSLGPVQGFISMARRTRDFWAGSFILSYLAGCAMLEVIKAKGELRIPAVQDENGKIIDPLLEAISKRSSSKGILVSERLEVATLPNRFQAEVPEDFNPSLCVKAVMEAWTQMAEEVWQAYVQPAAPFGKDTQKIWERQINGFWEVIWAIGDDPSLLALRKNWRTYVPPVEPKDKCTLMGSMQEISGYLRSREKKFQNEFWEKLRGQVGDLNLAEDERLCAVALVKRLFPLVAESFLWRVPQRYPSTPFLAAVPWIEQVCRRQPEKARQYAAQAAKLPGVGRRENPERFRRLKKVLEDYPETREFASLDGNCFFDSSLANANNWNQRTGQGLKGADLRRELKSKLLKLAPPASPFYAMLTMDGDRMGELLKEYPRNNVSSALLNFSKSVQDAIKDNNGVVVFSGGDDVLALLPVQGALPAAVQMQKAYRQSFAEAGVDKGTISGAVVYAHFTVPLTAVYRKAHRLLDDVAKEKSGRDSLAITVWKGAGPVLTWSAPWKVVIAGENNVFAGLVDAFRGGDKGQKEFSSSFFYNLRSRFEILQGKGERETSEIGIDGGLKLAEEEDVVDILTAEYLKNRERQCTPEEARERVKKLLAVCRRCWRDDKGNICESDSVLSFDGALLVKFLAGEEVVG